MRNTIDITDKTRELAAIVGDDGSGDLRVIVDADPEASLEELADIVRAARAEAAAEYGGDE